MCITNKMFDLVEEKEMDISKMLSPMRAKAMVELEAFFKEV